MPRIIAAALALGLLAGSGAAHAHGHHHRAIAVASHCVLTNAGREVCRVAGKRTARHARVRARQVGKSVRYRRRARRYRTIRAHTVRIIPHPQGCPPRLFCACGLARFWGIWRPALNLVANWARSFRHVAAPDIGIAAVRRDRHHVMGIIGGGPGHWRTVDFNSGGHLSRVRVVSNFRGYFFVDPRERRAAK